MNQYAKSSALQDLTPKPQHHPDTQHLPTLGSSGFNSINNSNTRSSRGARPSESRMKYLDGSTAQTLVSGTQQEDYALGRIENDPFADLDYLITQIVRCDEQFCEKLPDMHMDTMMVGIGVKYPEIERDMEVCVAEHGANSKPCNALFLEAVNRINPMIYDLIEQKRRAISVDPLVNYDGLQYLSPFWFTGAGDIWRRIDGRSKRTTIADCNRVKKRLDECLALPENQRTNHCFDEYASAQICVPGTNCPYLRLPMTQCMYSEHIEDYRALDHCLSTIPRFQRCQDGFVPADAAL